ncbi:hypothetical protein SprV_0200827200 [Sparganum proliferum]
MTNMMETHDFIEPYVAALSKTSVSPPPPLECKFTVCESRIKFGPSLTVGSSLFGSERIEATHRQVQSASSSRSGTAITYWYHTTFGDKTRACNSPCSFIMNQNPRVTQVRPEISAALLPGSCGPGYTYVFDSLAVRRILEDTAAQISAVPPALADPCCPNPGLHP